MASHTSAHHASEAERLARIAVQSPEESEQLLLRAAAHWEVAGDRPRATAIYDRLLAGSSASPAADSAGFADTVGTGGLGDAAGSADPGGSDGPRNPLLIKALKAANLWEYGHEAEARAIIDGIRTASPRDAAPWEIIAEALEDHDELQAAHDCFTAGATLLIDGDDVPYEASLLLVGRHRVRRLLGSPHDAWDALADTLHPGDVPLDELHDPKRLWALGSNDPAELRAEIARLRAELGERRAALSRPYPVAVLYWPERELAELLTAYPALAPEYPSHADHVAQVEASLRDLASMDGQNMGIVTATVPSFEAFAAGEQASPADASLLPEYATALAARGRATPWPPPRNGPCWCGSTRQYGQCHGAPAAAG